MMMMMMMMRTGAEWHTGDITPQILSDFDASSRSTNGYMAGGRCLNTLRYYGLDDGAVVALTSRQTTMSSSMSTIYANSLNRRLPPPRMVSKPTGRLSSSVFFLRVRPVGRPVAVRRHRKNVHCRPNLMLLTPLFKRAAERESGHGYLFPHTPLSRPEGGRCEGQVPQRNVERSEH